MKFELEIVMFNAADVITTSGTTPCGDNNDLPDDCAVF